MKTVSVALVLCLNVGVDPPDIVKTQPCARLECWIGKLVDFYVNLLKLAGVITIPAMHFKLCIEMFNYNGNDKS